jgi:hypothetical protein
MKKNYLLVNVFGNHGYSFMVYGAYNENNESEVIDICLKNNLFQDEEDAEYANVVDADENDVKAFASIGCIYDI